MSQEILPSRRRHPARTHRSATWIAVLTACLLVMSAGVGVAAIRYDTQNAGEVFKGVKVGGVDVGGMTRSEAEELITQTLIEPLSAPLSVIVAGQTFTTSAAELGATSDALEKLHGAASARGMGLAERVWTRLTGASLDRNEDVEIHLDAAKLDAFISRVAAQVDRPVLEPKIHLVDGVLRIDTEEAGFTLDKGPSRAALEDAATQQRHVVTLKGKVVEPASKRSSIKDVIVVKVGENKLHHYRGENLLKVYDVATGAPGYPTPKGTFKIVNKRFRPTWVNPAKYPGGWGYRMPAKIGPGPGNPLGTRALDINSPGIRIHGTSQLSSLGYNASHGCVRMKMSDVEELFDLVQVGTPVLIVQAGPDRSVPRRARPSVAEPIAESDATTVPGQPPGQPPPPEPSPSPREEGAVQLP